MDPRKQIQEDSLNKLKELIEKEQNHNIDFSFSDEDGEINLNIKFDKNKLDSITKEMIASHVGGSL